MLQVCGHIKHVVVLVALHSCHHFTCCQCSHILTFHLYVNSLQIFVDSHTAKTGLLRCCLYTSRRLQWTAVSCKRSICNKIENKKTNSWKPFVWGFAQRSNTTGFRSIINLCMRPLSSTFFEFLGRSPGSTPLPPTGGRTRWWVPFLVLPVGQRSKWSFSRFLV